MAREKFKNQPLVDIMLDLETLSTNSDACIISIAAIRFDRECPKTFFESDDSFYVTVDATSCAMLGMDFDMSTVNWWKNQSKEAKRAFSEEVPNLTIQTALKKLKMWIEDVSKKYGGDPAIWVQGQDFDIPILKNAYYKVFEAQEIPKSQWSDLIPWFYANARDARTTTKVLATIAFDKPNLSGRDIDAMIADEEYRMGFREKGEKFTDAWNAHDALSDCIHSAYCVSYLYNKISKKVKQ